jgi:hypothetical protein
MLKKATILLLMLIGLCRVAGATDKSELFKQLVINPDFQVFKERFFGGNAGVKAGYQIGVEASYHAGLYTRWDRYYFDIDLGHEFKIGEALETDFSLTPRVEHDLEVQFARQFINKAQAWRELPYFVNRIPLDTEDAINKLKVGDLVILRSKLNFIVTAKFLKDLGMIGSFSLTGSDSYLVSGQFYILVLRLPENKIRLKLIAVQQKDRTASIDAGVVDHLRIFHVDFINGALTRFLDIHPLQISFSKGVNNLFMVDYILDLDQPQVAAAYNKVLRKATSKENSILANPLQEREKIRQHLLMDIRPLDEMATAETDSHREKVTRLFQGNIESHYTAKKLGFGIRFVHALVRDDSSLNDIVEIEPQNQQNTYQMESFQKRYEGGFLFDFFKVRKDLRMNGLSQKDADSGELHAKDWMVSLERRDADFSPDKLQRIENELRRVVPPLLYNQIDFSHWVIGSRTRQQNVATRYQATLHDEALLAMPHLSQEEIFQRYIRYLEEIPRGDLIEHHLIPDAYQSDNNQSVRVFGTQVKKISQVLAQVFSSVTSDEQKIHLLMGLRRSNLFLQSGMRFLIELLPPEKWQQFLYFHFEMESDLNKKVIFTYGEEAPSELFEKVLYLQKLMNGDGVDLRLESENLKLSENLHLMHEP